MFSLCDDDNSDSHIPDDEDNFDGKNISSQPKTVLRPSLFPPSHVPPSQKTSSNILKRFDFLSDEETQISFHKRSVEKIEPEQSPTQVLMLLCNTLLFFFIEI